MCTHSLEQHACVNNVADVGQGEGRLSEKVCEEDPASEGGSRGDLQHPFIPLLVLLGLGVRVCAGPLTVGLAVIDLLRGAPQGPVQGQHSHAAQLGA